MSCKKNVESHESILTHQSYAVQAGATQRARDIEKKQGYVCKSCGKIYCKVCLERHVVNAQRGAACPSCGGSFGYLQ